jgi:CDP-diacylglycerol pyrophosphatase
MRGWLRASALGMLFASISLPVFAWQEPAITSASGKPAHRDRLWHFVHDVCLPAAIQGTYPPLPCVEVTKPTDPAQGYAVFKDRDGRYQYLVMPIARITGIESPLLLAADAHDYFADAWAARLYVEAALHHELARDEMSLAVNSAYGRSQDQLHIHVDCVRADVHAVLQRHLSEMTGAWRTLSEPLPPYGHVYRALWLDGETLQVNPFKVLAQSLPASTAMAAQSLAVIGARTRTGKPGFILLNGHADGSATDPGHAEELQDVTCAIASQPPD